MFLSRRFVVFFFAGPQYSSSHSSEQKLFFLPGGVFTITFPCFFVIGQWRSTGVSSTTSASDTDSPSPTGDAVGSATGVLCSTVPVSPAGLESGSGWISVGG